MKNKKRILTMLEIVKNPMPFREPYLKLFYGIGKDKIKEVWKNPDGNYEIICK